MHKKVLHYLKTQKSLYGAGVTSLVIIFILAGSIFMATRGEKPHTSELAFTEYSQTGDGSVIPASCESSPWVANGDGNYTGCGTITCWNGSVVTPAAGQSCPPAPSGVLTVSPTSCTISVNSTTCTSSASWSTSNVSSPLLVDGNTGATLSTAANGSGLVVWVAYPQTVFNLRNGTSLLDTKTVTASCVAYSAWDNATNKCKALPPTVSATLSGNRTALGTINLTCTNANSWSVVRTEGGFTQTGTGLTASVNVTQSGNYTIQCIGWDTAATTAIFYANYPLLPADMTIDASPKTIPAGSVSSLTWSITNSSSTCMITAAPVCTSGTCSQSRIDAVAAVNSTISTANTDSNDIYNLPGVLRTVRNAIKLPAPNNNPTGLKALGKKSIPLNFTTDFTLDCGPGTIYEPLTPKKVRVQVTNDNEG